jgi:hypothetical protein
LGAAVFSPELPQDAVKVDFRAANA